MMTLLEQMERFFAHLIPEKRYSERTICSYREDLMIFSHGDHGRGGT